jgi:hypothetical protein
MGYQFTNNWPYNYSVFPSMDDHIDPINNIYFTGLHTEIENIEDELGLNPSGDYDTVANRLNASGTYDDWLAIPACAFRPEQDSFENYVLNRNRLRNRDTLTEREYYAQVSKYSLYVCVTIEAAAPMVSIFA